MKRVLPRLRHDGETFGRGPIIADRLLVDPLPKPVSRYVHTCGAAPKKYGTGRRQVVMCGACEQEAPMGRKSQPALDMIFPNRVARRRS